LAREGLVPIETIEEDDEVLTYELPSRILAARPVTGTFSGLRDETLVLNFGEDEVCCTPAHRFFTGDWTPARDLKPGTTVFTHHEGWKELTGIRHENGSQMVYNFAVSDTRNYLVGSAGFLVHNVKKDNPVTPFEKKLAKKSRKTAKTQAKKRPAKKATKAPTKKKEEKVKARTAREVKSKKAAKVSAKKERTTRRRPK